LIQAIFLGHVKVAKLLLAKGADVHTKVSAAYGKDALMHARGHAEVVKLLLAQGADANTKDDRGQTALMWASSRGDVEVVRLLLANGADAHPARANGHAKVVELLKNARASGSRNTPATDELALKYLSELYGKKYDEIKSHADRCHWDSWDSRVL
jgi:ankyrin repeat protein